MLRFKSLRLMCIYFLVHNKRNWFKNIGFLIRLHFHLPKKFGTNKERDTMSNFRKLVSIICVLTLGMCSMPLNAEDVKGAPPTPAEMSEFPFVQNAKENYVVGNDSYRAAFAAANLAASGKTLEEMDKKTEDSLGNDIDVYSFYTRQIDGYHNQLTIQSMTDCAESYASKARKIGAEFKKLSKTEAAKLGLKKDDVRIVSEAKAEYQWLKPAKSDSVHFSENSVDGFKTKAPYAKQNKFGVDLHFVKMDGCLICFIFQDEVESAKIHLGDWIAESIPIEFEEYELVAPSFSIESAINFRNLEQFEFLFDPEATFNFATRDLYVGEATHQAKFAMNSEGVTAEAVTEIVLISKGLMIHQENEKRFILDKPFYSFLLVPTKVGHAITFSTKVCSVNN